MSDILLKGTNLTKYYLTERGCTLTACQGVDIQLQKGETLGIVGESGCGKSTLLRLLTQLEKPNEGQLFLHDEDITELKGEALRKTKQHIQMVFQDSNSAFFSRMVTKDAISEPLRNFGRYSKKKLAKKVDSLLELVHLPKEFADKYPHSMSGGQQQRIGIARALALDPDILICDEATSSLDVSVQEQIIQLLVDIQRKRDLSMIFVCHDLALVQSLSHRIMVMYLGSVVEILPGEQVWDLACHPYTKALLGSVFTMDMDFSKPILTLEGDVPSSIDIPLGCSFHSRCPFVTERCRREKPKLQKIRHNHEVACHRFQSKEKEEAYGDR